MTPASVYFLWKQGSSLLGPTVRLVFTLRRTASYWWMEENNLRGWLMETRCFIAFTNVKNHTKLITVLVQGSISLDLTSFLP